MPELLVRAGRTLVQGRLQPYDVLLRDGVVAALGPALEAPSGAVVVEAAVVSPGFVDLHVHALDAVGTIGAPDLEGLSRALARRGVTGFLASWVATPVDELLSRLAPVATTGARCLGHHLEGPWLSSVHAGAQPREALSSPTLHDLRALLQAGPPVVITIAPELPGALDVVSEAAAAGVVVALGHTGATYAHALAAVSAGASHVTHCFNAMRPLHHREPGLVGAALDRDELTVEVIADGVHVHPAAVRLLWRGCGPSRLCLVSDAVDVELPGTDAAQLEDGTLAGARVGLDQAVRNCHAWGIPLEDALAMASVTPAARLGRDVSLRVGGPADLTLLGDDLDVLMTVVDGVVVWERSPQ